MFSKEDLQSYRDIKAPDELYDRVMQSRPSRKRNVYGLACTAVAIAACLAILLIRTPDATIIVNGQQLHKTVQFYDLLPTSDMRTSPVFSIPMEIDGKTETTLSVSHGVLTLPNGNTVTELTTKERIAFHWEFPRSDNLSLCRLKIQRGREISYIDLTYDHTTGMIRATKNKQ